VQRFTVVLFIAEKKLNKARRSMGTTTMDGDASTIEATTAPVKEVRLAQILIHQAWCKGCAICAELCPKHVFIMRDNLPVIVDLQACNRCMLCEMRCPDFAITVL
jgi:2-oxoglutarate ferredoxin oxidoreductase subunit delta